MTLIVKSNELNREGLGIKSLDYFLTLAEKANEFYEDYDRLREEAKKEYLMDI